MVKKWWLNGGKTMGKPLENHGKTMGKPWENHGKTMAFSGYQWILSVGKLGLVFWFLEW